MGEPQLSDDPRFASHRARGEHQQELDGIVAGWTRTRSLADLLVLLEENGIPAGPVADAAELSQNAHFRERGALVEIDTPDYGALTMQGVVPRLSETPGAIRWVGPTLGEHTDQVLAGDLGLEPEAIASLRNLGIV